MKHTIQEWHEAREALPSDINEHMGLLRSLAMNCWHVTEFGVRSGNSTVAFLAGLHQHAENDGKAAKLRSYDINPPSVQPPECLAKWEFTLADTSKLEGIEETDMLFIDTLHDFAQVEAELKHAPSVRKWLVFHDTVLFGFREESTNGLPGILQAVFNFLASPEGSRWQVWSHYTNNCGLLVLSRR